MLTKPSLTLKRRLKAAPSQVFAAWTDPQKIVHWFGPNETVAGSVRAKMDVRPGGSYQMNFQTDDGEKHQVGGVYREVVPNRKLAFSWAWQSTPERESLVTIELDPVTEGTMLTLTHEQFFDEKARDDHGRGWNVALDRLQEFLG